MFWRRKGGRKYKNLAGRFMARAPSEVAAG